MNCPECKHIIEEEDFDLYPGQPLPEMVDVEILCPGCSWAGCAVLSINSFMSYAGIDDPETAA